MIFKLNNLIVSSKSWKQTAYRLHVLFKDSFTINKNCNTHLGKFFLFADENIYKIRIPMR